MNGITRASLMVRPRSTVVVVYNGTACIVAAV